MRDFTYIVTDKLGIHARPAKMLVKEAKEFESKITISKGERAVEASKLMGLMSLGVKQGDSIVVHAEGADEEAAIAALSDLLEKNL